MSAEEQRDENHGRRVLALWLCWLALAVFLVAAGVIVW